MQSINISCKHANLVFPQWYVCVSVFAYNLAQWSCNTWIALHIFTLSVYTSSYLTFICSCQPLLSKELKQKVLHNDFYNGTCNRTPGVSSCVWLLTLVHLFHQFLLPAHMCTDLSVYKGNKSVCYIENRIQQAWYKQTAQHNVTMWMDMAPWGVASVVSAVTWLLLEMMKITAIYAHIHRIGHDY